MAPAINKNTVAVNLFILLVLALTITNRFVFGGDDSLYYHGNNICLLVLSFLPFFFVSGKDVATAAAVPVLMLSNAIDDKFFNYAELGANEGVAFVLMLVVFLLVVRRQKGPFTQNSLILLVIMFTSWSTRNYGGFHSFNFGDKFIYISFATMGVVNLKGNKGIAAALFVALAMYDLMEYTYAFLYPSEAGDLPFEWNANEIVIAGYFIARTLWIWLKRRNTQTGKAPGQITLLWASIVFHALLVGSILGYLWYMQQIDIYYLGLTAVMGVAILTAAIRKVRQL